MKHIKNPIWNGNLTNMDNWDKLAPRHFPRKQTNDIPKSGNFEYTVFETSKFTMILSQ